MKFPKYLFITEHKDRDDSKWLNAHREQVDAAEDEDRTGNLVATYQLVKTNKLEVVRTIRIVK